MDVRRVRRTAIMIDGGFYRKRAIELWGRKTPEARAEELFLYCLKHIQRPKEPRDLYRIFYYDCPPMEGQMVHPLTGETICFSESDSNKWMKEFFQQLTTKRKVAMRMGELAESQARFVLKPDALTALLRGWRSVKDLTPADFTLDVRQKGTDMRVGLDIASLAYGRYVDQVVLIAGDSDFVPAAKMARRNGIDFILDPLKQFPKKLLLEHIDGLESYVDEDDADASPTWQGDGHECQILDE